VEKKRIVFCGSKRVGLESFDWLLSNKYIVEYLVVGEDHYKKYFDSIRKRHLASNEIAQVITHQKLEKLVLDGVIDKKWLIVSVNYRFIFNKEVCANTNIINLHLGITQNFRGCHSPTHAIIAGKKYTGCTLHEVTSKIDAGNIIAQVRVPIYKTDTGEDVYFRDIDAGIDLFITHFASYFEEGKSYPLDKRGIYKKCSEIAEKEIVFSGRNGDQIFNFIRAHLFSGYSSPYFFVGDRKFEIHEVKDEY
jgi:methionyl-tRNA formyltransferase